MARNRCARTAARPRRSRDAWRPSARISATSTLVGVRDDNPAAGIAGPRRPRSVPRTLSPAEAERLVEAAARHHAPRNARSRARRAALRRRPARLGGGRPREEQASTSRAASSGSSGRASKERLVPLGRPAAEALRRYLALGRPHLDRRHRPDLFLNARGGALTRVGRVPDPAASSRPRRARAGPRPPAPPPPFVRDAPARRRRRPAQRPGDARPRGPRDDGALHARLRPAPPRGVLQRAPARAAPRRARARRDARPASASATRRSTVSSSGSTSVTWPTLRPARGSLP